MTLNPAERAERVRAYRASWPQMGVWSLRCTVTGARLVGASLNIPATFNRERFSLRLGSHRNTRLQDDWRRHGEDAFVFEVLDELAPPDDDSRPRAALEAEAKEQLATLRAMWLDELRPWGERGYCAPPTVPPPARFAP